MVLRYISLGMCCLQFSLTWGSIISYDTAEMILSSPHLLDFVWIYELTWDLWFPSHSFEEKSLKVYWFWEKEKRWFAQEHWAVGSLLVCQGCCNKVPQCGWLKQQIYCLFISQDKSEIKVSTHLFLLRSVREGTVPGLSLWLIDGLLHVQMAFSLYFSSHCLPSLHIFLSKLLLFIRTSVILD